MCFLAVLARLGSLGPGGSLAVPLARGGHSTAVAAMVLQMVVACLTRAVRSPLRPLSMIPWHAWAALAPKSA
eukprot:852511-Heterocapsa_arctica.AAC.1